MSPRWMSAPALDAVLAALARAGELVAPVRAAGEVVFARVDDPRQVCRDYVNTLAPPRHFLLPSPEVLLRYRVEQGRPVLERDGLPDPPRQVIFGIRSCDVAAIAYLDRFLSGAPFGGAAAADRPFAARRERTTLIGVTCAAPGPTCMCVCCEGGPALAHGFDWQLTRLAGGWQVEVGSPRGERLAARFAEHLRAATRAERDEARAAVERAVRRFQDDSPRRVQTMNAVRMLSSGRPGDEFWDPVGERCFECGTCAFVCPTCFCFNVADVAEDGADPADAGAFPAAVPAGPGDTPVDGAWRRVRVRDACTLAGHGRLAGGSYPRETCGDRCRIRFFHKLSWQFHRRMERLGCTGCGRCIESCPGDIGIDRVSARLLQAMTGGQGRAAARAAGAVPRPARTPVVASPASPAPPMTTVPPATTDPPPPREPAMG